MPPVPDLTGVLPQSAVVSPNNAIFNLAGLTGLPTIAPLLNVALPLTRFRLNSLYISPIFADSQVITFTPYSGGERCSSNGVWRQVAEWQRFLSAHTGRVLRHQDSPASRTHCSAAGGAERRGHAADGDHHQGCGAHSGRLPFSRLWQHRRRDH
jgi:hypothetical protein